jgi:hypothetical protein
MHPDAVICYQASDMSLHIHRDASYLSEKQTCLHAGGIFFLSKRPEDPTAAPKPGAVPLPQNGAIHVLSSIMKLVLLLATEAELGALFYNAKDKGAMLRNVLEEMGHPQPPTPIPTDNACTSGTINDTVKQMPLQSGSTGFATTSTKASSSFTGNEGSTTWQITSRSIIHHRITT